MSTPQFIGIDHGHRITEAVGIIAAQPMPSWEVLIVHVIVVTLLSNLGKMFPLFFYRDRQLEERLALSVGMFTRGEVGAGIIVIAMGYNPGRSRSDYFCIEFGTQPAFDRWFCGHCETFGTTGLWTERIDGIKIPFLGDNGEKKNKLSFSVSPNLW